MITRTVAVRKSGLAIIILIFAITPSASRAQVAGASLSGTVNDTSGAAMAGAQVSIANVDTGVSRDASTDSNGFYTAPNLLPGNYAVTASAPGFATQVQKGITLTVGGQQTLNFSMRVGQVSEKVEVVSEATAVQLTSSDISAVVNSTTVRELPLNGRSWTDLATLQPGVVRIDTAFNAAAGADRGERGFGTQLSISGGKPVQNNYRLDGISVNDFANGAPGSVLGVSLGVDAIQEFSVLTTNYSAEYGRTSGGVVNAITRSGTNDFHGSLFEFLRNSALDARNVFDKDPNGKFIKSPFRRNQFGASAGGPIQKDRTFIFGNYEGIRQSKGVASAVTVPSDAARMGLLSSGPVAVDPAATRYLTFYPHAPASAQIPGADTAQFSFAGQQVLNEDYFTIRTDHKFSEHDTIFGTFFYDNANFSGPDALDQVLNGHHIDRKAVIVEETHIFTPAMVNSLRFGYNQVGAFDNNGISAINPEAVNKSLASTPGMNAARVNIGGIQSFNGGLSSLDHFLNAWKSFQLYDDAFYTRHSHSIKFGIAVERIHNGITSFGNAAGNWNFGSLHDFLTNVPQSFSSALDAPTPRNVRQSIFGLYVQDDWRLRSNLTLNLGLRYEMATVPSETNGKFVNLRDLRGAQPFCGVNVAGCAGTGALFSNPTLRNFEPRVGFAWDPFRDGKTAVRGGFGIFDVLPLPYSQLLLQYRPAPFYRLGATTTGLNGTFFNGAFPLLANNVSSLSSTFIEPHPHRNYVMQWNLNVQRQVTPTIALLVGYVGNRGVHQQFRVDDANMSLPTLTPQGYLFPLSAQLVNANFTGGIRSLWWNGNSTYNALVTSVTKRISHGLQVQGSFTWGKSIDNNSAGVGADSFGNSISSLHWYDLKRTRAVSDYNVGRTLSISTTWEVPGPTDSSHLAYWLLGGWELGGIVTAHDGLPITPLISGDPLNQASSDTFAFPDRLNIAGCGSLVNPGNVNNYIKAQCFGLPQASPAIAAQCAPFIGNGTPLLPQFPTSCSNLRGNAGRNIINGPGLLNFDFSVFKNFPVKRISERFNIQFRAEFFNVFNHHNFQAPADTNALFDQSGNSLFVPGGDGAGSLHSLVTDPREIQFALKFVW